MHNFNMKFAGLILSGNGKEPGTLNFFESTLNFKYAVSCQLRDDAHGDILLMQYNLKRNLLLYTMVPHFRTKADWWRKFLGRLASRFGIIASYFHTTASLHIQSLLKGEKASSEHGYN